METIILNFNGHDQKECQQGSTFDHIFVLTDPDDSSVDLTNYTAKMQVRKTTNSLSTIVELSTANTRITIDSLNGRLRMLLSATETALLTPGRYVYDLELTKTTDGTVVRLFSGEFVISPEVTR